MPFFPCEGSGLFGPCEEEQDARGLLFFPEEDEDSLAMAPQTPPQEGPGQGPNIILEVFQRGFHGLQNIPSGEEGPGPPGPGGAEGLNLLAAWAFFNF